VAHEARLIVAQEARGIKVIIIVHGTRSTSQIIITTVCKHILRDTLHLNRLVQCTIYTKLTAYGYKKMCSPAGAGGR
jgi:tRNA A-37 threonylcarbamoyl transferase component Bud32